VSVLALPGGPTLAELGEAGVGRISTGGGLAYTALGAVVEASRELLDAGTFGYFERMGVGRTAARAAFAPR
jgi:2-methylisocitrate lyase-like PEP mutase family enzyme